MTPGPQKLIEDHSTDGSAFSGQASRWVSLPGDGLNIVSPIRPFGGCPPTLRLWGRHPHKTNCHDSPSRISLSQMTQKRVCLSRKYNGCLAQGRFLKPATLPTGRCLEE